MLTAVLDTLLLFALIAPIVGILSPRERSHLVSGSAALIGLLAAAVFLVNLLSRVFAKPIEVPLGAGLVNAVLVVDIPGLFIGFLAVSIGILVVLYSLKFMERDSGTPFYFGLLTLMVAGMVGVGFAGDLFTLFVFWELMCISSYVLVGFRTQVKESVEAAVKYIVMSAAGSATALFGMSMLYGLTGTLNLVGLASALASAKGGFWLYAALAMLITGFGVKAAIVPLHTWLPDAYTAAPSPVSTILAGASTELAVFVVVKLLFFVFPALRGSWVMFFATFSVLNMLLGNVVGLLQNDVKRILAYSSIAHIGYIFIGVAAGTQLGLTGALLHIFNHGLLKALAFLCIGAIIYRLGARTLDDIAASLFILAILGLIGMPPLNGFISKLVLFTSSLDAGMLWLGVLLVIFSAVSTGYYLRILKALIAPPSGRVSEAREAPALLLIPMIVLAFLVILFGVWPDPLLSFAKSSSSWLMEVGRYA